MPFLIVMSSTDPSLWPSFELLNRQKITTLHAIPLRTSLNTFHPIDKDCRHLYRLTYWFAPTASREVNNQRFICIVCQSGPLYCVFIWRGPSLVYHFYWKDSLTITRCAPPAQSCLSCSMTSASFAAVARMKEYGDISCINWCEAYLSCGEGTWLVNKGETHALQHIQSWHSIQDIEHRSNWTCTYWRPFQIICTNLKRCVFQCVQIICNTFYVNELIFSRLSAPIWNVFMCVCVCVFALCSKVVPGVCSFHWRGQCLCADHLWQYGQACS